MIVVPYIELEERRLMRPQKTPEEMGEFASRLSTKFKRLYLADLDGIFRNRPQLDIVREICEEIPTLYEGGVRVSSNVIDMLITGAERCVVGTAHLRSLDDVRGAFKLSENITLKVDFRDGIVSFDPHIAGRAFLDLARDVAAIGVSDIVVPKELAEQGVAAKRELSLSLGVFSSVERQAELERLGADYIVSADYERVMGDERT